MPSSARTTIVVAVDDLDGAGTPGGDDLAGVDLAARYSMPVPTSGADGAQQRHGLALHVRTHEGAVRVVVLEERDERGRDRHHLARRDVHVVDLGRDAALPARRTDRWDPGP